MIIKYVLQNHIGLEVIGAVIFFNFGVVLITEHHLRLRTIVTEVILNKAI